MLFLACRESQREHQVCLEERRNTGFKENDAQEISFVSDEKWSTAYVLEPLTWC